MNPVQKIDFQAAKAILDTEPNALMLDVRVEEEYITGHAVGALLFTLADITPETAAQLIPTQDTPVILYCRTGRRSKEAAARLADFGYTRVYNVGGLIGWPYGLE